MSGPGRDADHGVLQLETQLVALQGGMVRGYVLDPGDLGRKFVVELHIDGHPFSLARADAFDPALLELGFGDGCFGFSFFPPRDQLDPNGVLRVFVANADLEIGGGLRVGELRFSGDAPIGPGEAVWRGGLAVEGWTPRVSGRERPRLRALIDEIPVAEAEPGAWTMMSFDGALLPARRFELWLPERFADGVMRRVRVLDEAGQDLRGSPLGVRCEPRVEDGEDPLDEPTARNKPVPFHRYDAWARRFAKPPPPASGRRTMIVLFGRGDVDASIASLSPDAGAEAGWIGAALPPGAGAWSFSASDLREAARTDGNECDILIMAPSGAIFEPGAADALAAAFDSSDTVAVAYGDLRLTGRNGERIPAAFPAFDYARFLEQGYPCFLFAVKRDLLPDLSGEPTSFDLFAAALEHCAAAVRNIAHVPRFLATIPSFDANEASAALLEANAAHLARRGLDAELSQGAPVLFPNVRVTRKPRAASVTLVLCARGASGEHVDRSVDALKRQTARQCELIVAGASIPPAQVRLRDFERTPEIAASGGSSSPARAMNLAAARAEGDYLCFVDSCAPASPDWLDELLSHASGEGVGAVGPRLIWPDGTLKSAGLLLSPSLEPAPIGGESEDVAGYLDMMRVARSCAALPIDCLLVERQAFTRLGGFDDHAFPNYFHAVDLCVKIAASGGRSICAPRVRMMSTAPDRLRRPPGCGTLFDRELNRLRLRWGSRFDAGKYHNPQLAVGDAAFEALAAPPRSDLVRLAAPERETSVSLA